MISFLFSDVSALDALELDSDVDFEIDEKDKENANDNGDEKDHDIVDEVEDEDMTRLRSLFGDLENISMLRDHEYVASYLEGAKIGRIRKCDSDEDIIFLDFKKTPKEGKYCRFDERVHRSNNCYFILNVKTHELKFSCHKSGCKEKRIIIQDGKEPLDLEFIDDSDVGLAILFHQLHPEFVSVHQGKFYMHVEQDVHY